MQTPAVNNLRAHSVSAGGWVNDSVNWFLLSVLLPLIFVGNRTELRSREVQCSALFVLRVLLICRDLHLWGDESGSDKIMGNVTWEMNDDA